MPNLNSPAGPMEDAIRLEIAISDGQVAGRGQIVLLRYNPEELLDPAGAREELQPFASGVEVQINPAGIGFDPPDGLLAKLCQLKPTAPPASSWDRPSRR